MDYFDFIKELRKGKPDLKKAEKAMKILGWVCVLGAIWNFMIFQFGPFEKSPFHLPLHFRYPALISFLLLGALFFISARGIRERVSWGKRSAQLAVVLLTGILVGFIFLVLPIKALPLGSGMVSILLLLFFALFVAQFVLPAYFAVRYLGRLPVKDSRYIEEQFKYENISKVVDEEISRQSCVPQKKYKDALFPFGIFGTCALIIGLPLLIIFILERYFGPGVIPYIFIPAFLFIFFGPVVYNYIPSPFQKERSLVASYTGGGSIFLFGGSWPFFRLLIYDDGVEVRSMFHRYFIPCDRMADVPDKIGFFSRGLLIKSDLPGVPSGIRFSGFGMKKIVKMLNEMRTKYLAKSGRGS